MRSRLPTRLHTCMVSLLAACSDVGAADWAYSWNPAHGDKPPQAEICPFKYGKQWAYAIEIDDGPKWARGFAVPLLAGHGFTDAPPGVAGGKRLPFVGGIAVIVASTGANDATIDWNDLAAMRTAGWGVLNHSLTHSGRSWGDEAGRLSDAQVREDAYWSQALLAHGLDGRAPTAAVYANGYTDYNRGGALAAVGIRIATRVGGSSPNDIVGQHAGIQWMDYTRNYLDEGTWVNDAHGDALAGIPGIDGAGGERGRFIIDFTHDIDRSDASANQQRWTKRLSTIEERWGAKGTDTVWCAPTGEIADYARGREAAKVATVLSAGKQTLTLSLPDGVPGSAFTVRITGIGPTAELAAPRGGALYRAADGSVYITTPVVGQPGSPAPTPAISCLYDGPPGDIDLKGEHAIAGIMVHIAGDLPEGFSYHPALKTASGMQPLAEPAKKAGWFVSGQLLPLIPNGAAVNATGVHIDALTPIPRIIVWGTAAAP